MNTYSIKDRQFIFILSFFIICFILRFFDSFLIRSDQSIIGELIFHKLVGILLLGFTIYILKLKWFTIGFQNDRLYKNIMAGLVLCFSVYIIAYYTEYIIETMNGNNPYFQFYVSSYNIHGNKVLSNRFISIIICIIGNIINVIMEEGVFRGLFIHLAEEKYSFIKSALISSFLFGIWHIVMPLRNFIDGEQSLFTMVMNIALLVTSTFLFGFIMCLLFKVTGSIWVGMAVHFVNNASINLIHIITINGADEFLTLRITIAQTILSIIVLCLFIINQKRNKKCQI
jgi:uncharacterized protein